MVVSEPSVGPLTSVGKRWKVRSHLVDATARSQLRSDLPDFARSARRARGGKHYNPVGLGMEGHALHTWGRCVQELCGERVLQLQACSRPWIFVVVIGA